MMFLISSLAVWRITHMLLEENGPWELFKRVQNWSDSRNPNVLKEMLQCFYCTSVWVSLPFAIYLGANFIEYIIYTMALSAVAMLIQTIKEKLI